MSKQQGLLLDVDPYARRDEDFYATPAWMVRALLRRFPIPENLPGCLVEPCVGDGSLLRCLPSSLGIVTNDIVARPPMVPEFLLDARERRTWEALSAIGPIAIVLTNPPFSQAFEIVQWALEFATCGVVMLLRISWIEPTEDRGDWLAANPPTRQIVLPRWNFRGRPDVKEGGGDMVPTAWFLWAKQPWFCQPGMDVVTKREMRELIAAERRGR